ncbi:hypothetical protein, partial [Streptomyces sp. NPDC097610]|uniref:hypothetical protein n=1 Tax=Streptomyces sp. NPDC097610 TaxID=3157227 RepID=UPI0033287CF0
MTHFDSDAELDALLRSADEAVLTAVEDGLDLDAGRAVLFVGSAQNVSDLLVGEGLGDLPAHAAPGALDDDHVAGLQQLLQEVGRGL